jgi:hypothetical protein
MVAFIAIKKIVARFEIVHLRRVLYQLLCLVLAIELPMLIPLLLGKICFSLYVYSFSYYNMYLWRHIKLQATKKIADAKLAKDFQAVLKEFQKAQRLAVEREAAYAPFISQVGLPQR